MFKEEELRCYLELCGADKGAGGDKWIKSR
jgi:hypothetical protein